jgi:hypothetical protein
LPEFKGIAFGIFVVFFGVVGGAFLEGFWGFCGGLMLVVLWF